MVTTKQLEEGKILNLILKFSGPAIIGMIVQSIYNIVDRIYIGHAVGPLGLAGIAVGFPIMMIGMAITMMIGMGATSLISIRLGEKKPEEAEKIMGNALTMMLIISSVIFVLALTFLKPLLTFFGASEGIMPYAYSYMRIIVMGVFFQTFSFGANNFIRAQGNPKTAAATMLIGALMNIVLDPILIFGFNMGVAGAATATIISQGISAAWVLHYFIKGKSILKFRRINMRPRTEIIFKILPLGAPMAATQLLSSVIVGFVNNTLQLHGGDLAISAFGIIHSFMMLVFMPIMGISQGVQPIIGYNFGARQFDRVKETFRLGVTISTAIIIVGFILVQVFPHVFVHLFSTDPELTLIASQAFRIFFMGMPVIGFQILGANYFQATGKPKQAMLLNLSRQGLFFLPLLFILPNYFGLNGVFAVQPAADYLAFMITATLIYFEMRNLSKKQQEKEQSYTARGVLDAQ